jgi:hypothetical protein
MRVKSCVFLSDSSSTRSFRLCRQFVGRLPAIHRASWGASLAELLGATPSPQSPCPYHIRDTAHKFAYRYGVPVPHSLRQPPSLTRQ